MLRNSHHLSQSRLRLAFALCVIFGLTPLVQAADPPPALDAGLTGEQIAQKMLDRNRVGFDAGEATITMRLKTSQGSILDRKMLARASKKSGLQRTRMTFLEPKDQHGIEVLLVERKHSSDLQYLYLPATKQVRRMGGAAKNARFQGSDFTYGDLESRDIKSGTYKRLADTTYAKKQVYHLEVTPEKKPDQLYSKVQLWIDGKTMLPFKTVFFDRTGKKLKVLKIRRIKKVKGHYVPTKLSMRNVQEHSETVIEIGQINSSATYPDSLFSPEALGK